MSLFQNSNNSLFSNPGQQAGLFNNPAANQPTGMFGQQPTSLFGNTANPNPAAGAAGNQPGQGPSLFAGNTGGSLFAAGTGQNTGSLFGANPAPTGSLFGNSNNAGGMFAGNPAGNPGNPGNAGGLFGNPAAGGNPSAGGLFGNPAAGGNPSAGGLFGNTASGNNAGAGGLFGNAAGGAFGSNPGQGSGLFGQTLGGNPGQSAAPTGSLFGNPGGGLFGTTPSFGTASSNTGSLFGNTGSTSFGNPAGGLFGAGNPSMGMGFSNQPLQNSQNLMYTPYQNYSDKIIESLAQADKDNLFNLKSQIESNEANLIQAENTLTKICKFKDDIKARLVELFSFARKVQTAEKRCKASLEVVKKFQSNISLFIKDAVKVFDRCERADGFNQIDSPGVFLNEMLASCEERLKCIEESFKEIQELVLIEDRSNEFMMLVKTISMMQTKFELVSSLTFDMHKRVQEVMERYLVTFGIDMEEGGNKDVKIKEASNVRKPSGLADLIAAKPSSIGLRFY